MLVGIGFIFIARVKVLITAGFSLDWALVQPENSESH